MENRLETPAIRLAEQRDLPAIVEIYNQAIRMKSATADTVPVTLDERGAWLAGHDPSHYPVFVAVLDDAVVGYCSLSPYRAGRMALRHTAEISYYIHEKHRRKGIGSMLIEHAIRAGPRFGLKTLFAILFARGLVFPLSSKP